MIIINIQLSQICTLVWIHKCKIEYLVAILKERGYIKYRRELFKLFENPGDNDFVRWDGKKFPILAYLLHLLHENKYFIITGNKGYFAYAEKYFTDFEGNKLKKDYLKNLCTRVKTEETRFALVRAEVDEIIAAISSK